VSYVRLALNDSEAPAQLFDGVEGEAGSRRAVLRRHPERALVPKRSLVVENAAWHAWAKPGKTAGGDSKKIVSEDSAIVGAAKPQGRER